jgi:hypothetical protein
VKKIPIESTCAEFWNVWFMPPPAPRCRAGMLFITPARFGAAKAPIDSPISSRTAAKSGYEKSTGSIASRAKLSAETSIPPVAKGREP